MANSDPWPFMPPQSTEMLLMHCDDTSYTATPDTIMYKLVDAICGTTGAGALVNEIFLARAAGALETIYFNDLDYIFSKVNFLSRAPEESYPFNPLTDVLTADQWNEIRTKDAWYRARIKDFFIACGLGTTLAGIRMCVQAALAVDCEVFEVWRYIDSFGITEDLGRAPVAARNELIVKPHKDSLLPEEARLLRDMLGKMVTLDTIPTISLTGLAVQSPVTAVSAAADSTYFEVQKVITPTPLMSQLPPPELLPIDLAPTEQWMYSTDPVVAPYAAFNITQEYAYWYLIGGGKRSPIDSVTYGIINSPISTKISVFELFGTVTTAGHTLTDPPQSYITEELNSDLFSYTAINFQADLYPVEDAVDAGVASLISAINACRGSFAIVATGIGAIIASNVYDQIRSGSLTGRRNQFLGATIFGNPRRQAGRTFPGSNYISGKGLFTTNLLAGTEDLWWEFVVPADITTDNGADTQSTWLARVFANFYPNYSGNISAITASITPPVPNATTLTNNILSTLYGNDASNPHRQYTGYQPLLAKGDHRSCAQIATDYITGLAEKRLEGAGLTLQSYPVIAYEVGGTQPTGPEDSFFSTGLDPRIKYVWVPWPAQSTPLATSVTAGINNLITMINRNPGKFMLIGSGKGALVTAGILDQLNTGALAHRESDLLAAVAFGSPVREEGHSFPDAPDPGGHGIAPVRMEDTPDLWWDFADPLDPISVQEDDVMGEWMGTLWAAILATYDGDLNTVISAYPAAPVNTIVLATTILNIILQGGQLVDYSSNALLAEAGDNRSSYRIAADYLDTFAAASTPYTAPPTDPMSTYQPEANFESFTTASRYGPWQTYEVADSPDNFPGGKFGQHRYNAPALNPDGTPYNFPWPSQASYVTFKMNQVISMGGQADNVRFRTPTSATTVSKEVFLPEYAIAYSAPAMDSTVSQSLTARRSKTVNQSGSNQNFARVTT